jgi:hypothetical protein
LSFSDPEVAYARLIDGVPSSGVAEVAGYKLVVPGHPEQSLLFRKLHDGKADLAAADLGAPMPLAGTETPGPKALDAVRRWVEAGAPFEGASFEADWLSASEADEKYVRCEAQDEAGMRDCFEPVSDPLRFKRLYTPPLTIPPASEKIMCSFLGPAEETLRLRATSGQQMAGGHHIAIFVGLVPPSDEMSVDCAEIEMGNLRFVAGAGGAGGQDTSLPEGVALSIEKGSHIVIQSHYINATTEPVVVMDAIDMELTDEESSPVTVDPFSVIDSTFSVPPGAVNYRRVKDCLIDQPLKLYMMLGHTHDYGVLFDLEIIRAEGPQAGVPELFYHATDGPLLRDNPEIVFFDNQPVELAPGDVIRVTCEWTNPTDVALGWPEEMCVALMYYTPGQGFLMCDTADVSPVVQDGAEAGEGCALPTDGGNDLGVGKYCTQGGGECADTAGQTLCLAEFDATANYCSVILCEDDSVCGEGASCVFSGPGSACVPTKCQ